MYEFLQMHRWLAHRLFLWHFCGCDPIIQYNNKHHHRLIILASSYRLGAPPKNMTYLATPSTETRKDNQPWLRIIATNYAKIWDWDADHLCWSISQWQCPCTRPEPSSSFIVVSISGWKKQVAYKCVFRFILHFLSNTWMIERFILLCYRAFRSSFLDITFSQW